MGKEPFDFIKLFMIRTVDDYNFVVSDIGIKVSKEERKEGKFLDEFIIGWWHREVSSSGEFTRYEGIVVEVQSGTNGDKNEIIIPKILYEDYFKSGLVYPTIIYPIISVNHNQLFDQKAKGYKISHIEKAWEAYIPESTYDEIISRIKVNK